MRKPNKILLSLQRETIRNLSTAELGGVAGGLDETVRSGQEICLSVNHCPTTTCPNTNQVCSMPGSVA